MITDAMITAAAAKLQPMFSKQMAEDIVRELFEAALSSAHPAPAQEVDGWALVPIEHTVDMEEAYFQTHAKAETVFATFEALWSAILAAAPTPASAKRQEVEVKPLEWAASVKIKDHYHALLLGEPCYEIWLKNGQAYYYNPDMGAAEPMPSLAAAKSKAQQDYESRIRSALVPSGSKLVSVAHHDSHLAPGSYSVEITTIGGGAAVNAAWPSLVSAVDPNTAPPFKPCIIRYDEAGVTEMVLEDCPTIAGTEMTVRPLLRMSADKDDRPIVGFQWDNAPKHSPPATDKLALAREALRPFDAMAKYLFSSNWDASNVVLETYKVGGQTAARLTAGDFFAVRAALSTIEESET